MERFSTVFSFFCLIASVFSQQQPTVLVVPASAVVNSGISVVPAATVLKANGVVPAAVITCQLRDILPSGSKCIVKDCGRFREVDCNNASTSDLHSTFQSYMDAVKNESYDDQGPSLPLYVRLAGVSGNLTQDNLAPVADQIRRLELVNTNIGNFTSSTFANLSGLTNLDLNGVLNDVIPTGAFDSLGSLQVLQIRNMPNLRLLEKGSLENLWDRNTSVCVNIDISDDSFVCDCDNNAWIQTTLLAKANKVNVGTVAQIYSENATAVTACGLNIVCSQKSPADFRRKLMDINVNVTCANATNVKLSNNVVVVSSTVVSVKASTVAGAGHMTNSLWVTSLLVVLYGILARV